MSGCDWNKPSFTVKGLSAEAWDRIFGKGVSSPKSAGSPAPRRKTGEKGTKHA